jgi:hypothetical protein
MVPSAQFIDSFERLRRMPDVVRYQTMTNKEVDSSANSNVGRGVQRIFGGVLPVPHDDDGEASASNLRAAATNVAQWLYGADEIHVAELAIRQLMHDSTNAEASYRDYRLVDDAGAAIKDYGVRRPDAGATVPYYFYSLDGKGAVKPDSVIDESGVIEVTRKGHAAAKVEPTVTEKPKAMTKSSITADRLTLEELKTFPGSTNAEKLQTIMAKARQVDELEKQLEYQRTQNAKLRKAMESTTAPATEAVTPAHATAQTTTTEAKETTMATTTHPTTAPADDIRKLEDSQLAGKKSGFAEERIRRTVAAIQDYNAGRELEEQIEINVGSIRALAAASASKVGAWCKDHAAELQAYADGMGHPYGPNSKFNRGKDFLSLVPLAWNQQQ